VLAFIFSQLPAVTTRQFGAELHPIALHKSIVMDISISKYHYIIDIYIEIKLA
jgi:hypothetical protein